MIGGGDGWHCLSEIQRRQSVLYCYRLGSLTWKGQKKGSETLFAVFGWLGLMKCFLFFLFSCCCCMQCKCIWLISGWSSPCWKKSHHKKQKKQVIWSFSCGIIKKNNKWGEIKGKNEITIKRPKKRPNPTTMDKQITQNFLRIIRGAVW